MKILHISPVRELASSQRKQLLSEHLASRTISSHQWDTVAFQVTPAMSAIEHRYPPLFRPLFLRNLYTWLYMLSKQRDYDFILQRHMTFDPFVFVLGPMVRNRVTVHHSKEVEELRWVRLGWKGRLASMLERFAGRANARFAKAIVGVTPEIARYELETHGSSVPAGDYPNGIDLGALEKVEDRRSSDCVRFAFVCSTFAPWQGLELLIASAQDEAISGLEVPIEIYLIGHLTPKQMALVNKIKINNVKFFTCGHMETEAYQAILSKCDIGIGSLAIGQKGLTEATTLKVREYLAQGLPVYSGHKDSALPETFPFYRLGAIDLREMSRFAVAMRSVTRADVRALSAPLIDKGSIMRGLCAWLEGLQSDSRPRPSTLVG